MTPLRKGATSALTALLMFCLLAPAAGGRPNVSTSGIAPQGAVFVKASLGPFRVSCSNHRNRRVMLVADYRLEGIGNARPSKRIIRVNPHRLAKLPAAVRLFWYAHECAHHRLPPPLNRSETAADCWAIKRARDAGLLRRDDVRTIATYLEKLPGSRNGHLPGPLRSANVMRCFDTPARVAGMPRPPAIL